MKKILSILLVLALLLSVFVACKSEEKPAAEPPAPTDAEAAGEKDAPEAPKTPEASSSDAPMTVYFITKTLGNQYWAVIEQGVKDAAAELGVNVVVTGLANESEVEKQVQLLQDAVSAEASAILIGPTDSTALAPEVSATFKSGIPIIMIDTMINTEDYSAAFLTDNITAGEVAAEEMLRLLKEAGNDENALAQVALQMPTSGSQTVIDRIEGFNNYWNEHAPKAWEVLNDDIKVNDGDISKAVAFGQDFITAYPDLKGVFGPNNGSTVGFVTALRESGNKDIVMVGFDFSDDIKSMIEAGEYKVSSVVQQQYLMGYDGLKAAVELAKGNKIPNKTVDTGVLIVHNENLNDPEVQEILNPTV